MLWFALLVKTQNCKTCIQNSKSQKQKQTSLLLSKTDINSSLVYKFICYLLGSLLWPKTNCVKNRSQDRYIINKFLANGQRIVPQIMHRPTPRQDKHRYFIYIYQQNRSGIHHKWHLNTRLASRYQFPVSTLMTSLFHTILERPSELSTAALFIYTIRLFKSNC